MQMFMDRQIPMLAAMCRSVGVQETINRLVAWDEDRCLVSPGDRVGAMICNLLVGRQPLYVLNEFFHGVDTEKCFGFGVLPEHLNDHAMGRALDKLADAGPERVYGTLVLHVICQERVAVDTLHADTTSVSVHGEYEGEPDDPVFLTHGYSKDRRPDLKQFLFGLGTTHDGIPVIGQMRDGNLSDSVWYGELPPQLRELCSAVQGAGPAPVLVGDSKLVSKENLKKLMEHDQSFISRVPSTFSVVDHLKRKALSREEEWEQVGALSSKKKAALYKLQAFDESIDETEYRFVVVHSSSAEERKNHSIHRRVARREQAYSKGLKELGQRDFACEADAQEAWQAFLKEHKERCLSLNAAVVTERRRLSRNSKGRPPRDYVPEYETVYHLCPSMERDEKSIKDEIARGSCFVLITSLPEDDWSHRRILEEYKEQTVVEQHFEFIKQPQVTGPIYLKNPRRVHALGYVFLMALLVYAVMQRRARNNVKKEGYPMIVARNVKTDRPTGRRMIQQFFNMVTYRTDDGERHFPTNSKIPHRAFRLLGLDPSVYLSPHQPP